MWRDWKWIRKIHDFISLGEEKEPPNTARGLIVAEAGTGSTDLKKSIIKKLGLVFSSGSSGSRLNYEDPAGFNFTEIERAYLTDSFLRQALDKYVDFMFKAGWDVVGSNPKSVEYINMRLRAMALATQKPISEFLIEIAEDLIRYHNVFIIKARASGSYAYPGGVTATPTYTNKTVAGYFVMPVSTVKVARDENGTVKKYKQEVSGSNAKPLEINPTEIVHISVDKAPGRAYGFPFVWQTLDDIKLLRQMEELVDRMVYKNIFPLLIYQVGLEKEGFQATDEEIEAIREQLGELTMDGGMVLPERHKVYAVGAEGKALDVLGYLEYFKKRVFTGLGVSPTIMGESDSGNKSTSDNLDQMFKDRIKAYQKIMSENINNYIIEELLLEGGFDTIAKPEDKVEFRFREIDLQAKMAEENHAVQMYTQNAITHEEMRQMIGRDPVTDEARLYFNMVTIPTNLSTIQAKAEASADSTAANNAGQNKNQPSNQHGTKPAANTRKTNNSVSESAQSIQMSGALNQVYHSMKSDVINAVKQHIDQKKDLSSFNIESISLLIGVTGNLMLSKVEQHLNDCFTTGITDAVRQSGKAYQNPLKDYMNDIAPIRDECKTLLVRLLNKDLQTQVERVIKETSTADVLSQLNGAFAALQYRLEFLSTTHTNKAYNYGFAKAARALGVSEVWVETSDTCADCIARSNEKVDLMSDDLPPFHPNCSCRLIIKKEEGE